MYIAPTYSSHSMLLLGANRNNNNPRERAGMYCMDENTLVNKIFNIFICF